MNSMSEFSTLNGYKVKDKKAIRFYDNVATMKADTTLKDGMHVKTKGYYSVNDGGGADYNITNTLSVSDYQEELNNNLYATLIINDNTNILNFGGIANDINEYQANDQAISDMITYLNKIKISEGTYTISNSIIINNIDIDIKGIINYSGSDYAFTIVNGIYKNININKISAENGGGLKLEPTSGNSILYCNFNFDFMDCYKHSIYLNGLNGNISLCNFKGIKIRSTNENAIYMEISNGNTKYLNENIFTGIDIASPNNYGVYADITGTSTECQFKMINCNFENCDGIHLKDKVSFMTLLNCRLNEIVSKNDWLFIENQLPTITILGEGIIYPKKFKLTNVTANRKFLYTNLDIYVNPNGYYYYGGGFISSSTILQNGSSNYMEKSITADDLTNDHYYTLPFDYDCYNAFRTSLNAWLDITIPNNVIYKEFYFYNGAVGQRTFRTSNAYTTINDMEIGYYKIILVGNKPTYIKLNS
nr:MAG TPA: Pectate lyase [Caudoviricetes sp.]